MDFQNNNTSAPSSFWQKLADKMDFAKSRPLVSPGYEEARFISRDGKKFYVLKSPAGDGYIRLSVKDYFLFSLLDGSRMVQEVLVEYFKKYGALAFSRLGTLVQELFKGGFLSESPRFFYGSILKRIKLDKPFVKFMDFVKSLPRRQWAIANLDNSITWLYEKGFKVFYFQPGHESYPTFREEKILKVLSNAARWAKFSGNDSIPVECREVKTPLEKIGR